jgi:hypothetical protein
MTGVLWLYNSIGNEVKCRIYSFSNMNIETSRQAAISATRRRVASNTSAYLRCSSHTEAFTVHPGGVQHCEAAQDGLSDCTEIFRDALMLSNSPNGHILVAAPANYEPLSYTDGRSTYYHHAPSTPLHPSSGTE